MRTSLRGWLVSTACSVGVALLVAAPAAAQTLYSNEQSDALERSLEYENEGWRNLRKVYVSHRLLGPDTSVHIYIVCGTNKIIFPQRVEPAGDYSYPGKTDEDIHISFGRVEDLDVYASFFTSDGPAAPKRVKAALRSTCSAAPKSKIEPSDINFGFTSDQFGTLLTSRFTRSGDKVTAWYRTRSFKSVDAKIGTLISSSELDIIDDERGSSLSKIMAQCDSKTLAFVQHIEYDKKGDVVDSYTASTGKIEFRETVPDSVGESRVEIACLLE